MGTVVDDNIVVDWFLVFRSDRSSNVSGVASPRNTIVMRNLPLSASRDTTFTASATGDDKCNGDVDGDDDDDNCNEDWPVALNGNKC